MHRAAIRGALILVVASAACSLNKPVATAPPTTLPPFPSEGLVADLKAFAQTLGVEATNNFEVSRPISMLCGGLDRQIEHHLFPKLAPERLRQIAPEVRAVCEKFGVKYRTASWGKTLKGAFAHIAKLSAGGGGARAVAREMT